LQNNTFSGAFIGQNILILPSVHSTNAFIKDNLSNSTPFAEGTAIMAVEQYAGKGQRGARWQSDAGQNLTFSVLLHPKSLATHQQFLLTQAFSVALIKALNPYVAPKKVAIKWPNDVYIDGRKLGGMLIENMLSGHTWKTAIVGIGLNINAATFEAQLANKAVSLRQICGHEIPLRPLLVHICQHLDEQYQHLLQGEVEEIKKEYEENLFLRNVRHTFYIDGVPVEGIIQGVSDEGLLQVDFNGYQVLFNTKEIAYFQ
jgi:BirA family biotin operon repressor/biotin-[acetyl-CoA-carboxylase] ligase